ncbi:MAG TPA: zinc ribbon domain-containing protein [Thermoanaerobaculia bacterium]|nr:zinc ribbon domain-containing protein [Thermoanaerobaculia bacterium]HQR67007.1 zinc ribbon domain-containing protein [Thermoanaerobaculia bacterium]
MPILEYRCATCEGKAEFIVLAGDRPAAPVCPRCGSPEMSRLLSTFAAHASSARTADAATMCGGGPCTMPGMCGPSACGFGEN